MSSKGYCEIFASDGLFSSYSVYSPFKIYKYSLINFSNDSCPSSCPIIEYESTYSSSIALITKNGFVVIPNFKSS